MNDTTSVIIIRMNTINMLESDVGIFDKPL